MKDCNSCGKCCIHYGDGGLSASAEDIEDWHLYRPDIARYAVNGEIWVHPDTGLLLKRCPWLEKLPDQEKYICGIYAYRPEDCRHYPVTVEDMIKDDCEMLQVQDLAKPKQAQRRLNQLMADSRPAYLP